MFLLPVRQRTAFKILRLLIVYKAMNGQAPIFQNWFGSNQMHIHTISVVLKQKWHWEWEIVLVLVQHLRLGITFLFQLGNPNQLFHLRLSWKPTCLCKLFLTHKCQLFHCTLLVNDQALSQAALFNKFSREYLHSCCTIIYFIITVAPA